jgi:hypothetical protein
MTASVLYVTTDNIRAAIGVDDADISDPEITDARVDVELQVDLGQWLPAHASIFAASQASSPTSSEILQGQLLTLYCQFKGAAILAEQGAYRFLQKIADGKNQQSRFTSVNWEDVAKKAKDKADKYKDLLNEELGVLPTVAAYPVMSISSASFDPITGGTGA